MKRKIMNSDEAVEVPHNIHFTHEAFKKTARDEVLICGRVEQYVCWPSLQGK